MHEVETYVFAAGIFVLIKLLFQAVSWYAAEDGDVFVREKLDSVFDVMQEKTFFEIAHDLLVYISNRFSIFIKSKRNLLKLFVLFFFLNVFSLLLGVVVGGSIASGEGVTFNLEIMIELFMDDTLFMVLLFGGLSLLGVLFDIVSLIITMYLLRLASKSQSLLKIIGHIVLDIYVAIAACFWAFISLGIISYFVEGDKESFLWVLALIEELSKLDSLEDLADYGEMLGLITLGLSSVIPTLSYIFILSICFIAHVIPDFIRKGIRRFVYLVTSDDTPVFSRLGTIFGGLGAFFLALSKLA